MTMGPPIHYKQREGEWTCMVFSMASAMHWTGNPHIGSWIYNKRKRYLNDSDAFIHFTMDLCQNRKVLNQHIMQHSQPMDLLGEYFQGIYLA